MDPNKRTRLSEQAPDPFCGRTVDGYRIESVIGRGGMGTVYKATQLSLGRPVALKVLAADLVADGQFLARFKREADALSRLSHPNVVAVYERGEVDGQPYLVMEFVEGATLRDVMRDGPLPSPDALRIVSSVLAALEHAHEKGIIHRDIKPENVMLAKGDIVKVADFGLSRLLGPVDTTRLTRTHLVLGTYEYMAPEQREKSREADPRSDLYATGVVLYEMLTGELPIGRFDLPSRRRPGECDGRIDQLVDRSLDKDPERRYQRASEMGHAVSAILERPSAFTTPVPRRGSDAGYKPFRFEYHLDNVATIDHVLGTIAWVIGFLALFSVGFLKRIWMGMPFFIFFIAGWYLQEVAKNLRRYHASARTGQAVIAICGFFTGILAPFSVYSLWVLFSHRGRTYFDARGRGLSEQAAAAHTYRMLEEPYPAPAAPPAPPPPVPRPSQIPVQSMVTSEVAEKPERVTSGFVRVGFRMYVLTLILVVCAATFEVALAAWPLALLGGVACVLLGVGLVHSLAVRRVKGALLAFVCLLVVALVLAATVLNSVDPPPAIRLPDLRNLFH